MPRFLITETPKQHASIGHIVYLVERLKLTDKLEVRKEIGSGYFVEVTEGEGIKPRMED